MIWWRVKCHLLRPRPVPESSDWSAEPRCGRSVGKDTCPFSKLDNVNDCCVFLKSSKSLGSVKTTTRKTNCYCRQNWAHNVEQHTHRIQQTRENNNNHQSNEHHDNHGLFDNGHNIPWFTRLINQAKWQLLTTIGGQKRDKINKPENNRLDYHATQSDIVNVPVAE